MAVKSPSLRERVERNVVVWFLGALLTGFLSGAGAYRAIQEVAGLKPISGSALEDSARKSASLEKDLAAARATAADAADRLKQAYQSLAGARVGIMYVE